MNFESGIIELPLKNQLPQKQGLRQCFLIVILFNLKLKNQLPQKQGLRLALNASLSVSIDNSKTNFHKNKD